MPRLTTKRYLQIHHELAALYQTNHGIFAGLSSADQGALHTFFQTTRQKPDEDLVRIREQLTRIDPSLPQQAGRAYKHLQEQLKLSPRPSQPAPIAKQGTTRTRGERIITIRTVQRPDPDMHKLARVLVKLLEDGDSHLL